MSSFNLDNIDKKIIEILQQDSSISNLDLSKKIGLAPSSCLLRTKNLAENKIIKNYTIVVDEEALGYNVTAFAKVMLSPLNRETTTKFIDEISNIPQVVECYTITGGAAFLLKIVAKDLQFYRDFIIDKILNVPSVSNVETDMVVGIEKNTTVIPLD